MTSNVLRSATCLSTVCVLLVLPSVAFAQNFPGGGGDGGSGDPPTNVSPPAEKLSVTETGVDIRTGRFAYSKTDLALGSLSLVRQLANDARGHLQPFGNLSHGWDIFIAERRFDKAKGLPPISGGYGQGNDYQFLVHYGGSKQVFSAFESSQGTGHDTSSPGDLTLVSGAASRPGAAVYQYESLSDGTLVEFRPMSSSDCSSVYRCAYVSKITNASGEETTFSYDTGGNGSGQNSRLTYVESSLGYAVRLEYGSGALWHNVTKACVFNLADTNSTSTCNSAAAHTVTYAYSGSSKLASMTDTANETWQYAYPANDKMAFYYPGESTPYLTNTSYERQNNDLEMHSVVTQQDLADGLVVNYQYLEAPHQGSGTDPDWLSVQELAGGTMSTSAGTSKTLAYDFPIVPGSLACTNPTQCSPIELGDVEYQVTTGPTKITDEIGREWVMDWCDPVAAAGYPPSYTDRCLVTPLLHSSTDPEGAVTYYEYDGRRTRNSTKITRVAKPGGGLADIVTEAAYDCSNPFSCSKPIWTEDANGNRSDMEYSAVHGGITRARGPAVDGIRPETRYTYAQKYAWLKNPGSGYSQSSTPIWLLTSEYTCRSSAMQSNGDCASGAADKVTTTYEYQQGSSSTGSNLLRVGTAVTSDGETLRTCAGYDQNGRPISETQPKADLASCQ